MDASTNYRVVRHPYQTRTSLFKWAIVRGKDVVDGFTTKAAADAGLASLLREIASYATRATPLARTPLPHRSNDNGTT